MHNLLLFDNYLLGMKLKIMFTINLCCATFLFFFIKNKLKQVLLKLS